MIKNCLRYNSVIIRFYSNSRKIFNIENKALFGGVVKEEKKKRKSKKSLQNISENETNGTCSSPSSGRGHDQDAGDKDNDYLKSAATDVVMHKNKQQINENDYSSEMYWLTKNQNNRQYQQSGSGSSSLKWATPTTNGNNYNTKSIKSSKLQSIEASEYLDKQNRQRVKNMTKLPKTLTQLSNVQLPNPIKSPKSMASSSSSSSSSTSSNTYNIQNHPMEIPFTDDELKNIPNYNLWFDESYAKLKNGSNRIMASPIRTSDGIQLNYDEIKLLPSVGTILQSTMSESSRKSLMNWKTLKIAELGLDGFNELQKHHLTTGSNFHRALQKWLECQEVPGDDVQTQINDLWKSVSYVLNDLQPHAELIEKSMVHPILKYKGVVDCVSTINNQLTIIEWKKSDSIKSTISATYDAPLQLCAYLGALKADVRYSNLDIKNGLIVIAYTNGKQANAFPMKHIDLYRYWRMWLYRLQHYWIMRRDGTLPEPI